MARLARLVVPGLAHYVVQRGHNRGVVFGDAEDRAEFLRSLREAAAAQKVAVHAYALADHEVQLLVTPPSGPALSRMMQTLGRRYVSAYNRRYGRSGTLWEGRYRCAVVEPGAWLLAALRLVDGEAGVTSAGHRTGAAPDPLLSDPTEFWRLGNTPFEREAAWRARLAQVQPPAEAAALRHAALGGWAIGAPAFLAQAAAAGARPVRPRPRGRPARAREA
jgi:putative transposase